MEGNTFQATSGIQREDGPLIEPKEFLQPNAS